MSKVFNVLIVDDHPLIVKAYQSAVKHVGKRQEFDFKIDTANNCDSANALIQQYIGAEGLDLVFLDISLPPSEDGKIISGEDLGMLIREVLPEAKIVVSTTYTKNVRLNSILKSIDPDGFLIKNDLTPEVLTEAIESVLEEPPYYCKTVLKFLRKKSTNDFVLDRTDRQMLFELSKGAKMKDLPGILNLSIAAIERRKRILKEEFNVESKGDRELLQAAEDSGFI
ncbi:response regulator [Seonamhaeicola marinus]|uniref:Response regulator transcription factor n=1 Tax=Seonamhaeicola marinus TaxID=1912246 RepID=A0A5D0IUB3_9FLAO|nr:response regulator [Seonamhaeicola marinus]TYA86808.1 response regulator transcription factor [Seonamhaeicola marinus]